MVDSASAHGLLRSTNRQPLHIFSVLSLLIAGLFFITLSSRTAIAATYYVDDAGGNDGNLGTSADPWKTLNRAYTWYNGAGPKVQEGDTVYFRNGNYGTFRESTDDGQGYLFYRNNWITYKADVGHTPTLSTVQVENADKWGGAGNGRSYIKIEGFALTGGISITATSYVQVVDCNITLQFLTIQGYHAPYVAGYGVKISDANYITVQGCNIQNAYRGIGASGTGNHIQVLNNTIHYIGEDGMSVSAATDGLIQGNYIYDISKYRATVQITGTRTGTFTVDENVVQAGTNAQGIYRSISGSIRSIYQTSQTDFKTAANGGGTISGQTSGATLSNITKVDYEHTDGIQVHSSAQRVTIRGNIINRGMGQGGAQGLKTIGPDDITIENNLVIAPKPTLMSGLGGTVNMNNNTFVGPVGYSPVTVDFSFESGGSTITNMYNNIWQYFGMRAGGDNRVINHGNNIFGNNPNGTAGPSYPFTINNTEVINCNVDSLFVDAANGDFRLTERSIARDFGNPAYAPATDIAGKPRDSLPDAGCYEYRGPVLETIGDKSVFVNNLLTFTINATDPDGDPITYSAQNLPSGATFVGQTFSWTPTDQQVGTYQVKFAASDGAEYDSETITIAVRSTASNRPPVLAPIGDKSLGEGAILNFTVSANDADGDPVTYSVQNLPSGAAFAGQTFTWTPAYNQAGTYQLTFTVSDGLAQDSETITIAVGNVNRAPVLGSIGDKSAYANELLTFSVQATDADNDQIQYSAQGLASGATFTSQTFNWTPSPSQVGGYSVTFIASDGRSQDSEAIAITVHAEDKSPPSVTNCSPAANSIQVPLNSLITLHVVDTAKGVDANSVIIKVNNGTVYTGNTTHYSSPTGDCRRIGTKAGYTFSYQPNEMFDFEQQVTVAVNATDLGGNVMNEYSYSFWTEMRSFGKNKKASSGLDNLACGSPATTRDSTGNTYVVWHAGPTGSRDIYFSRLTEGAANFGSSIQLTADSADQCNPAIAIDGSDYLYVVWQDNRRGNWDIYMSNSADGINWSAANRVTDSNNNEVSPAIAIGSTGRAAIAWQDDRAGNQDIYLATSSDAFANKAVSQITSVASDQTEPAITVDSGNTVYVVWTDRRNGSSDIYGAASNNGPWTNVPIVSNANNQSSPVIAVEAAGSTLHLLWVDSTPGNNDIFYATTNGLPSSPLVGSSIIDDSSGADQLEPAIAVTGSTGADLKVFACWQDWRNVGGSSRDTDIYFVELTSDGKTNIFVGDDGTNANQSEPAMAVDRYGYPYTVWSDSRATNPPIYYAGCTYMDPAPLAAQAVSASAGATVGVNPANIDSIDDVSVIVPAGACPCDVEITISRIMNPPEFVVQCLAAYDFGPSGMQFSQPVTVTIPYVISGTGTSATPYWFNSLTGALSQQGVTDIRDIVISPTLHALSFKTTHFTAFYLMSGSASDAAAGGGGGGGCTLSAAGEGNVVEFLLPYLALASVTLMLKLRDARNRRPHNTLNK